MSQNGGGIETRNTESGQDIPDVADVHLARARIERQVRVTPILNEPTLNDRLDCTLYCKCENLQRSGAFKFRGASNAIGRLVEDGVRDDVATHSSGNHGAALALAASLAGLKAHVVMPENSSPLKIEAVRGYGGEVHFCAPNQRARVAGLDRLVRDGAIPVHPYDNRDIIAGQGTAALEFAQSEPGLDALVTPLGGGGLISGSAIATGAWGMDVIGVEPEGAADTVASLDQGRIVEDYRPDTIADGLRAIVGQRNFDVIRTQVRQVLTVSDDEIRSAMVLFWQATKMLIEPSSATVIAAVIRYPGIFAGKKVGVIITGGNIHPADWLALTGGE